MEGVGLCHAYGILGTAQVRRHLVEISQHLAETHISHFAIVHDRSGACGCRHFIAAEEGNHSLGVGSAEGGDEVRGMKVAGCLAGVRK